MRIAVASAKGSPGATCFALALALVWPRPVVLVEADPAGGDLGGRFTVPDNPGLASLVVAARSADCGGDVWREHAHRLPVGADVVIAPAAARQTHAAVDGLAGRLPAPDTDLIFDVGRLSETSPAWPLARVCEELLVVSATDVASIDHTASLSSQQVEGPHVSVVLVGQLRYPLPEMAQVLGVPILASVPTDPASAGVLTGQRRAGRAWDRFGIPAAARTAALHLVPGTPAAPPSRHHRRRPRLRVPAFSKGDTR